jgi:DNA-damage-inducible protein J
MPANAIVRARIGERVKDEASVVLAPMRLTVSDAFRMILTRIAREQALPFELLMPNAVTIEAMMESRRASPKSSDTVEDFMTDLNADD